MTPAQSLYYYLEEWENYRNQGKSEGQVQLKKGVGQPVTKRYLYHYTSSAALINIIKTGKLRLTKIDYLNDYSELLSFAERIVKHFEMWIDEHPYKDYDGIEEDIERYGHLPKVRLKNHFFEDFKRVFKNVYVACFSTKGNDLSQWRAYCPPSGGYSIAFSIDSLKKLESGILKEQLPGTLKLLQCHYDSTMSDDVNFHIFMKDHMIKYIEDFEGNHLREYNELWKSWTNFTIGVSPMFKNIAFRDEAEWRIVYFPDEEKGAMKNLKYREGRSGLIPYFDLKLFDVPFEKNEIIGESDFNVMVGPSVNQDLTYEALKLKFKHEMNLPEGNVTKSDIPYRNW